jgi:hypothetical protein
MNVKAVVVIESIISSGNSGIAVAGNATPTPRESMLIESEVISRPTPRVASNSSSGAVRLKETTMLEKPKGCDPFRETWSDR